LTIHTYTYNCTNTNNYTDFHLIIVVACVLVLTHMAKDCFEGVHQAVFMIITLRIIVQMSMGNATINTIAIFAFATATTSVILKGEKRGDVNIIIMHCEQEARGTGASVTTFKARKVAFIHSTYTCTFTTCVISPLPRVAASHSAAATPPAARVPSATISASPEATVRAA